jgi:hypothetical protein
LVNSALLDPADGVGSAARQAQSTEAEDQARIPAAHGAPGAVRDAREQPAPLSSGRQLAPTIKRGADRRGLCLGDDEHPGRPREATASYRPSRHDRGAQLLVGFGIDGLYPDTVASSGLLVEPDCVPFVLRVPQPDWA